MYPWLLLAALALALPAAPAAAEPFGASKLDSAERAADGLSRRYGSGPDAARRTTLDGDVDALRSTLRRAPAARHGLGRDRHRLRAVERARPDTARRAGETLPPPPARGTRLIDKSVPTTDLDPAALGPP